MSNQGNLINLSDPKSLMDLLKNPIEISRLIAGVLASNMSEHALAAGRIVAAAIKRQLLCQLGEEINSYIAKGIIKENFLGTSKEQTALIELFKFIDEEVPDEDRFRAMKSIFLMSVSQQVSEADKTLAHDFLRICKQLTSGEISVLKAVYDLVNGRNVDGLNIDRIKSEQTKAAAEWLNAVACQLGHKMPSLVEMYEKKLVDLRLLSERQHSDRSGVNPRNFRLTDLGMKFCEFIIKY